uniref:Uncharacterized protein n=1 Tax=Cucumis sativus TaxID=3659 RepID=A0A0A0KFT1_CUCSA
MDEQRPFENTKNLHRQKAASVTLILADLCSSVFFLVLESERFSRLLSLNFPAFSPQFRYWVFEKTSILKIELKSCSSRISPVSGLV